MSFPSDPTPATLIEVPDYKMIFITKDASLLHHFPPPSFPPLPPSASKRRVEHLVPREGASVEVQGHRGRYCGRLRKEVDNRYSHNSKVLRMGGLAPEPNTRKNPPEISSHV